MTNRTNKPLPPKIGVDNPTPEEPPAPAKTNAEYALESAMLIKQALFRIRPLVAGRGAQARTVLDRYIEAVNPVLIRRDDALPLTVRPIVTTPDVMTVLFNEIGHMIEAWGKISIAGTDTPEVPLDSRAALAVEHGLSLIRKIGDAGSLDKFMAVPTARGAAAHVLMTGGEYRDMKLAEAARAERVEQARIARMEQAEREAEGTAKIADAD